MPYQFATENKDYSDFASGRVFYSVSGQPAFPVRLASEIFQRCCAIRHNSGLTPPAVLYDPCCGGAYHLSTLAYLQWDQIDTIIGSDINASILSVAERNLSLLTRSGMERRINEIAAMQSQYGKPSHAAAAKSAQQFRRQLEVFLPKHQISTQLFAADATNGSELEKVLAGRTIDMVIADVPYGRQSNWQSNSHGPDINESMLAKMLDALLAVTTKETVVAIIADKAQKCKHDQYQRVDRFQVGKRRITLMKPL